MNTNAETRLLSAEVLFPNDAHSDENVFDTYYQERGKQMPSINHSIIQALIIGLFLRDERYTVASELTLNLNGWQSTPDIAVYPYRKIDWLHDEARSAEAPLLTVEIVSPSQNVTDIVEKAEQYLANGVQSCWIVQPTLRLVSVMTFQTQPITYTSGLITDPGTGITLQMEEIFR
jgi:Uma2 family endonuclease